MRMPTQRRMDAGSTSETLTHHPAGSVWLKSPANMIEAFRQAGRHGRETQINTHRQTGGHSYKHKANQTEQYHAAEAVNSSKIQIIQL